jgi:hypothetical protein
MRTLVLILRQVKLINSIINGSEQLKELNDYNDINQNFIS